MTGKDVASSDVAIRRMGYMLMYGRTYGIQVCTRVDCHAAFQRVPFTVFLRKLFVNELCDFCLRDVFLPKAPIRW